MTGTLDLTGLSLVLGGPYTPAVGNVFTLATANSITGKFTDLPDGSTVTLNGATLRVNSTATAVTATVVSVPQQPRVVTAVGDVVRVLNPTDGSTRTFVPFPGFTVSVASADLTGDGVPDVIIGAGPGGGPHVRVFDGATSDELASFFAFDVAFRGGVSVAAGGGFVALGAGPGGGPHVKVVRAGQLNLTRADDGVIVALANFFAFDTAFSGGVSVALGDVTSDGTADLVVGAGPGGGPHVKVIDGTRWSQPRRGPVIDDSATLANFFAFDPSFTGGVNVAATDGRFAVGAGAGGEPQVKLYRIQGGLIEERSEVAFDAGFVGGVRVGFADADADGDVDLLTVAGPGGGPHLKAFNVAPFGQVRSEFVADPTDPRGVVV